MSKARQEQLLSLLIEDGDWVTAARLADLLSVTPRSIRTYVNSLNVASATGDAVESGPQGYRAGASAQTALKSTASPAVGTPLDRRYNLVRRLLGNEDGIDFWRTAEELYVSSATLDNDLTRIRTLLDGTSLKLVRTGDFVRLVGPELEQRKLLSRLAHDEMDASPFDVSALVRMLGDQHVAADQLSPLKTTLAEALGEQGYFINEFGMADVVMHIAIAVDRTARGRGLTARAEETGKPAIGAAVAAATRANLGVELGAGDIDYLASLIDARVVTPGAAAQHDAADTGLDPQVRQAVADAVKRAAEEFMIDIDDVDFVLRLALHVQNLRERASQGAWSRNPMTKSLKSSYPMLFEVAVSIADRLREQLGTPVMDDEVAYIAMHVGGHLERVRQADDLLTATIVCPGYYELHELLRSSVDFSLGGLIEVVGVETRVDPDWEAIDTDLVLTTIAPPIGGDRFVRIKPFLTDGDVERVQQAAAKIRRGRHLAKLRAQLERYFDPETFVRGLSASDGEDAIIAELGELLQQRGLVDEQFVARAIAREQMSSTAFTDSLAVPHALAWTASHTAIAIGIAESSVPWGDARVQVVALVAFAEEDKESFQTVFEQFVWVFNEPDNVSRIVRRGTTFGKFLDELVAVIDG